MRAMEVAIVSYHDFISNICVITQILINYSSLEIIELSIVEFDWIPQSPYFWMYYYATCLHELQIFQIIWLDCSISIWVLIDSEQRKAFKNLNFMVWEMLETITLYPFNKQNRYFRNESYQLSKISFDFILVRDLPQVSIYNSICLPNYS